ESPGRHVIDAIAIDQMLGEGRHELAPSSPVFGRRDDGPIVKDGGLRITGQVARHERQFDDRPHAEREQPIEDLVYAAEVIDRAAAGLAIDTELIQQDAMRPNPVNAELSMGETKRLRKLFADIEAMFIHALEQLTEMLGA